jgi:hypothetical protein
MIDRSAWQDVAYCLGQGQDYRCCNALCRHLRSALLLEADGGSCNIPLSCQKFYTDGYRSTFTVGMIMSAVCLVL